MTFPRLGAIAENAWAVKGRAEFMPKFQDYLNLLDVYNMGYVPLKKANLSFAYKHTSSLWFKRRVFHCEGIHVFFDNKEVERLACQK